MKNSNGRDVALLLTICFYIAVPLTLLARHVLPIGIITFAAPLIVVSLGLVAGILLFISGLGSLAGKEHSNGLVFALLGFATLIVACSVFTLLMPLVE